MAWSRKDTSRCERGLSQVQGMEKTLSTHEQLKVQEGKEPAQGVLLENEWI